MCHGLQCIPGESGAADKCRSWVHVCAEELALVHGLYIPWVWSEGGREAGLLSTGTSCSNLTGLGGDFSLHRRKAEMYVDVSEGGELLLVNSSVCFF